MENNKKKVSVEIAGNTLTLVTDEPEEFVDLLADQLNKRMGALTKNNFRISTLDAALLCAIESLGDKLKAEKRIRTLEAQAELYEVNLRNLREELAALKEGSEDNTNPTAEAETICAQLRASSDAGEESTPEDKIRALEKYLENKKSPDAKPDSARTREEKIRYIESLLRGNTEKK